MSTLPVNLKDPYAIIPYLEDSFVSSLSWKDRLRLRAVVKTVHLKHLPGHMITDLEADKLLEAFGPRVQQQLLKQALDAKVL